MTNLIDKSTRSWVLAKASLPRVVFLGVMSLIVSAEYPIQAQIPSEVAPTRLEPVTVTSNRPSLHDVASESDLIGPANQPEWTARRVFPETDIYVIPTGEFEFNQFYVLSNPRHGKPENSFESEMEFGLPWRTQFDVELNYEIEDGHLSYDSTMIELPHALADWGKIPLNPALNAGWRFRNKEPDSYIARLLLGDQFGQKFNFGANLSFERQVSGELETDYELSAAANYRLIENKLSIGAQLVVEYETGRERDYVSGGAWETEYSTEVLLGPNVLYRLTRSIYLGLTPLFGLTKDSPVVETYFLLGIDLEPFSPKRSGKRGEESDNLGLKPVRRPR